MRIVIDATSLLGQRSGIGRYVYQLAAALTKLSPEHQYVYFYGVFSQKLLAPNNARHRVTRALKRLPFLRSLLRQTRTLFSRSRSKDFDLFFETNCIPLDIHARRTVCTIHDFSLLTHPEWHPKDRRDYFVKHFVSKIQRAHGLITVSMHVKNEALQIGNLPAVPITVIPNGVDHRVFKCHDMATLEVCRRKWNLPANFIAYSGSHEPRKNLPKLISAYLELPEFLKKEVGLVLVGPDGEYTDKVRETIGRSNDRIRYIGFVDDETLAHIYGLASVFVYPSLYEGFGMPPIEAMACGTPVVVSQAGSLPEVCGDAACYVDPHCTDSITEGIFKVLTDDDLRRRLTEKGAECSTRYTWAKTARATLEVFEQIMKA